MSNYESGRTRFKGWKEDVVLSAEQVSSLAGGDYIVVRIGKWEDGTPAFLRVMPPTHNPDYRMEGRE